MLYTADYTATNDRPILVREGAPTSTEPQMSDSNKNLVLGPRWALTPKLTGRLTVGRNVTLTCSQRKEVLGPD
jgi:hypothetical protein